MGGKGKGKGKGTAYERDGYIARMECPFPFCLSCSPFLTIFLLGAKGVRFDGTWINKVSQYYFNAQGFFTPTDPGVQWEGAIPRPLHRFPLIKSGLAPF